MSREGLTPGELEDRLASLSLPRDLGAPPRTWLDLAREYAELERADLGDVLAYRRTPEECRARRRAWHALHALGYSYPRIAKGWDAGDHSTIVDGVQKFRAEHGITHTPRPGTQPDFVLPTKRRAAA